ncbi:LysR family transcriptional regulator [Caldimonas tepidiphila]|uniref:LysR family transcriptional regulator n=1 Tax=Caldimonas tepidiphila TaxID=2315841 RepID=UPI000E5B5189|nr:LysR family transcriptional regulator [Caldimonas tepidiphila]
MRFHQFQDTGLRYFLEVARGGSLAEASQQLHVSTSAISRQIAALEEAVGMPLFERHPRGMVLNAAGEILATHARRAQLDAERALGEIRSLQGLRSGRVRVAATEAFANEFLPSLMAEFRLGHEGIVFELNACPHSTVSNAVRHGDADIGLKFSRAPERDIRVEFRRPAPVLALVPTAHPLARARTLTLARMSGYPIALPAPQTMVREMIEVACSRQQLLIEPVLTTNSMAALHSFVVRHGGIAVSGEISVRHLVLAGLIKAIPITDPSLDLRDLEVQTLEGRTLPHAAAAFLDFLREHLESLWPAKT